ncbi:MAG: hypothetical protein U9O59_05745 [Actinomycetota bacterium]|nr:hypothetical protein [Actinomycetota bacterium]
MNSINKYIKIARDAFIKPPVDIEDRIIDRISRVNKGDSNLLDESFMDFFKKTNSRLYLLSEKIRNNQGAFAALATGIIFIAFFIFFMIKIYSGRGEKDGNNNELSSSENEAQEK